MSLLVNHSRKPNPNGTPEPGAASGLLLLLGDSRKTRPVICPVPGRYPGRRP